MFFFQILQYEEIVAVIDTILQRMLEDTHYDTVHNFVDFYESFRASNCKVLRNFFQVFSPPVNRRHHTCVSLGMEIIARVSEVFPNVADKMYLVSCEEAVENHLAYIETCAEAGIDHAGFGLEKEHSLVALKISVSGRKGIVILDPGYHVARVVTVMKDEGYPHTGWFLQSDDTNVKRKYCYTMDDESSAFVVWRERTIRKDEIKSEVSLIFVERPYLTAVDVTIKRNLVYNFR